MPRTKEPILRLMFVDSIFLFALLTLIGNITIHFWERYAVQNEIIKMKNNVHDLKDTINNIGTAYDKLHEDLTNFLGHDVDGSPTQQSKDFKARHFIENHKGDARRAAEFHQYDLNTEAIFAEHNKSPNRQGITNEVIDTKKRVNKKTGLRRNDGATSARFPFVS